MGAVLSVNTAFLRERTVVLGDGTSRKFRYRNETPEPAKNDWVADVSAQAAFHLNREHPEGSTLAWRFSFTPLTGNIKRVMVYDVSGTPEKFILQDDNVQFIQDQVWRKVSDPIRIREPALAWLCEPDATEHFFKIVLEDYAGEARVVYQPNLFGLEDKEAIYRQTGTDKLCNQSPGLIRDKPQQKDPL